MWLLRSSSPSAVASGPSATMELAYKKQQIWGRLVFDLSWLWSDFAIIVMFYCSFALYNVCTHRHTYLYMHIQTCTVTSFTLSSILPLDFPLSSLMMAENQCSWDLSCLRTSWLWHHVSAESQVLRRLFNTPQPQLCCLPALLGIFPVPCHWHDPTDAGASWMPCSATSTLIFMVYRAKSLFTKQQL